MGKRCNWSSRAVIGPGVGQDVNELGVPELVWKTQTVPERCTAFNLQKLRALLAAGEVESIDTTQPDGTRNRRAKWANAEDIQVGCTVHRLLQDFDRIIFNRQPSLHKACAYARSSLLGVLKSM